MVIEYDDGVADMHLTLAAAHEPRPFSRHGRRGRSIFAHHFLLEKTKNRHGATDIGKGAARCIEDDASERPTQRVQNKNICTLPADGFCTLFSRASVCQFESRDWEEIYSVAKLVYGLSQSLDGYVDHMKLGPPAPAAFGHFIGLVRSATGLIYGRRTYEIMRYWEEDLPDWDAEDREFAVAWRSQPKWVVSRSLKSVGPNSTLVANDFEKVIRKLKADLAGEIQVAGPVLAQSLTEAGLIDEYRLYLRPVVLGGGQPFFAGPRPPLHLAASDLIADDMIRLTYVPA